MPSFFLMSLAKGLWIIIFSRKQFLVSLIFSIVFYFICALIFMISFLLLTLGLFVLSLAAVSVKLDYWAFFLFPEVRLYCCKHPCFCCIPYVLDCHAFVYLETNQLFFFLQWSIGCYLSLSLVAFYIFSSFWQLFQRQEPQKIDVSSQ